MATKGNGFTGLERLQGTPKITEQMENKRKSEQPPARQEAPVKREKNKTAVSFRLDNITKNRLEDLAKYYGASKTRILEQLVDKEWALQINK